VDLSGHGITKLPDYIKFNIIGGSFGISKNKLTTLKGCPRIVFGDFFANFNELTSLDYAPERVDGATWINNNKLSEDIIEKYLILRSHEGNMSIRNIYFNNKSDNIDESFKKETIN